MRAQTRTCCVFDLLKELYERPCSWQKTSLAVRMPQAEPLSLHWHSYSSNLICSEAVLDDSEPLRPWALIGRDLACWREIPYVLSFGSKVRRAGEKSWAYKPFLHVTLYTHYSQTQRHIDTHFSANVHIWDFLWYFRNSVIQSPVSQCVSVKWITRIRSASRSGFVCGSVCLFRCR